MIALFFSLITLQQNDNALWYQIIQSRTMRNSASLTDILQNHKDYSDDQIRAALLTLGQNGDPSHLSRIGFFLRDTKFQTEALLAYGEVDGAPLAPLLELGDELRTQNNTFFVEALSKLATQADIPKLNQLWTDDFSRSMRNDALFHFWRVKNETLTTLVLNRLEDSISTASDGYIYYLYRARVEIEPKLLVRMLKAYRSNVRILSYATRIRTTESSEELVETLERMCASKEWRTKVDAIGSLVRLDKDATLRMANKLLKDKNPNVVKATLTALVNLRDPAADRILLKTGKQFSLGQVAALLDQADKNQVATFWPLVDSWFKEGSYWKTTRSIAFLGKSDKPEQLEQLKEIAKNGPTAKACLAFNALAARGELDDSLVLAALNSGDIFKMNAAMNHLGGVPDQSKWPLPLNKLQAIANQTWPGPDFHQGYLTAMKTMVDPTTYSAEVNRLLSHGDYQTRLTALASVENPNLETRIKTIQPGWKHNLPPILLGLATKMIRGDGSWTWTLNTSKGKIAIEMLVEDAPITCANMVYLTGKRYFNHQPIHRVVPNFVVQAGDSRGDGSGGPGYAIPCEINTQRFERGTVGMALSGKDTGGSQFFICHGDAPHLDGGYTVFGRVTKGLKVVDLLEEGDLIESCSMQ